MRRLAFLCFLFTNTVAQAQSQPPVMEPGPKSPEESLKCLKPRPGFVVELMVSEPLVQDPIAFAWGPDGKLWVVEMGDYPLGADGKGKPGGRVKFLEKSRPDGPYDKATLFLDNLGYPNGVTPWGKGVLITCAPDIFYAEDTDGDGKADKKVVLYTGFREGNPQHRVNGLAWGLDGWLYGANGDSGGGVKSLKTGATVDINGRDFRIKPDEGLIEAVSGQTQYVRSRDDWGNWFGNSNSNPLFHYALEDRYLKRNPHLLPPNLRVNVSEKPGASRVYPISKPLPRFNDPGALNHFTSACSAIIYRDNLFGAEFENNSFVSEPVHNLIHREIVKPRGVTFTSKRADDEQESEFLASSDNWFRPTMIRTGPDGALWVADMYRYVIEHPEWIPKDWQRKLDLRAGHDLGRIYRVYPQDKKPRSIPRLDTMTNKELAKALDSPSGWQRDMAQMLLTKRHAEDVAPQLQSMAQECRDPKVRMQALMTLYTLGKPDDATITKCLADSSPGVRRWAVFCCEERLPTGELHNAINKLASDEDPSVRLQLAYAVGNWHRRWAAELLVDMLQTGKDDPYLEAALLSSISQANYRALFVVVSERVKGAPPRPLLQQLLAWASASGENPASHLPLLAATLPADGAGQADSGHYRALAEILDILERNKLAWPALSKVKGNQAALLRIGKIFEEARSTAADTKAPVDDRAAAVRLLARGPSSVVEDRATLQELLSPQHPEAVQAAVIEALASSGDREAALLLCKRWKGLTPALRTRAFDVLLSRPEWTRLALATMEAGQILASEVDAVRRQRLLDHKQKEIRAQAAKLFGQTSQGERTKVVDDYRQALALKPDLARGKQFFAKHCAACHKLGDLGQQVGPDLASVGDKSPAGLLIAILDPNRAVEPRYIAYLAVTKSGLSLTGVLTTETSTSISLVSADGKRHDILRSDLEELSSTGKSAMPEGLEKELPLQDMADLIAFVRGQLPTPKPKSFPGNHPVLVKGGKDGTLALLPANGAIFGKTLVLEEQYGNLGYWSSPDDHVIWTVEIAKAGEFQVEFEWACAEASAGNPFVLEAAGEKLTGKVEGTGTWDRYRRRTIGLLRLPAGTVEITMRAAGPIRGALIDLKGIWLRSKSKAE